MPVPEFTEMEDMQVGETNAQIATALKELGYDDVEHNKFTGYCYVPIFIPSENTGIFPVGAKNTLHNGENLSTLDMKFRMLEREEMTSKVLKYSHFTEQTRDNSAAVTDYIVEHLGLHPKNAASSNSQSSSSDSSSSSSSSDED